MSFGKVEDEDELRREKEVGFFVEIDLFVIVDGLMMMIESIRYIVSGKLKI